MSIEDTMSRSENKEVTIVEIVEQFRALTERPKDAIEDALNMAGRRELKGILDNYGPWDNPETRQKCSDLLKTMELVSDPKELELIAKEIVSYLGV